MTDTLDQFYITYPTILVYVNELTPYPGNYQNHPAEQVRGLAESLSTFQQFKPIVVWRCAKSETLADGLQLHEGLLYLICGHGLWQGAMEAGVDRLEAKDISGVSREMAEAILVADNASVLGSEPIPDKLAALLERTREMTADKAGLGAMLAALKVKAGINGNGSAPPEPQLPTEIEAEKYHKKWQVQPGEIWKCGQHLIACLDSLDEANIKRVVGDSTVTFTFADPPYGIDIVSSVGKVGTNSVIGRGVGYAFGGIRNNSDGKRGIPTGVYPKVIGDATTETATKSFSICSKLNPNVAIWWGANYYADKLPRSKHWLVWDKQTDGNQFADAELAWTNQDGATRMFRHAWSGLFKGSEQGQRRIHPTQKPIALSRYCFESYGSTGDVILDPFLGSGITVLAAEELGDRRVIGFELEPVYVSTVLERWSTLTGQQPKRISQ